jgi:MFS family permease
MIMFTAFNSLQNIVSKLYEEYDYPNLGQTAVICIYLTFSLCTFFTSYVIKSFGYKKVMFFSSLGYAVFELTGLLIASDIEIPKYVAWITVCFGAVICGACASVIWVAQGAYTSQVASTERKS